MEKTPRILTKIGLVFELLSASMALVFYFLIDIILDPDFLLSLDPSTTQTELNMIANMHGVLKLLILVSAIIGFIMFVINYYFFSGLYKGRYDEEKARKVYLYQFIYGIICLFGNLVIGILYLLSGNQGRNGREDRPYTREGI